MGAKRRDVDSGGQVDNHPPRSTAHGPRAGRATPPRDPPSVPRRTASKILPSGLAEDRLENLPREDRAARHEAGEIAHRGGAGAQEREGLVGRVDAAGGDDLEAAAEARAGGL